MPTLIVFAGGDTLRVREDAEAVVKGLEDISPGRADLLKITRDDGRAVNVRTPSLLYVTAA